MKDRDLFQQLFFLHGILEELFRYWFRWTELKDSVLDSEKNLGARNTDENFRHWTQSKLWHKVQVLSTLSWGILLLLILLSWGLTPGFSTGQTSPVATSKCSKASLSRNVIFAIFVQLPTCQFPESKGSLCLKGTSKFSAQKPPAFASFCEYWVDFVWICLVKTVGKEEQLMCAWDLSSWSSQFCSFWLWRARFRCYTRLWAEHQNPCIPGMPGLEQKLD